jgi:hypothetical protein
LHDKCQKIYFLPIERGMHRPFLTFFLTTKDKRDFKIYRKLQMKYSRTALGYSSACGQNVYVQTDRWEQLFCDECRGIVFIDKIGNYYCTNCGLIFNDIIFERYQEYYGSSEVPSRETSTFDLLYQRAYYGKNKPTPRIRYERATCKENELLETVSQPQGGGLATA